MINSNTITYPDFLAFLNVSRMYIDILPQNRENNSSYLPKKIKSGRIMAHLQINR